jgi:hypothetical protein
MNTEFTPQYKTKNKNLPETLDFWVAGLRLATQKSRVSGFLSRTEGVDRLPLLQKVGEDVTAYSACVRL